MPIKITDAFKAVKGTGIFLDEKDFADQLKNNPKDTYDAISIAKQTKGLFLDYPDFETTLGLKKKDVVAEVGEQESPNGLVATPPSLSPLQSAQKNNTEQTNVDIFAVRGNVKNLTDKLAAEQNLNQSASAGPGGYIPVATNTSTTAQELETAKKAQENKLNQLSSKLGVSADEINKITDQLVAPIGEDKLYDLVKSNPDQRSRQIAAYNWLLPLQAFYKNTDPADYRKLQNKLLAIQGYQIDPTTGEPKLDENGNKINSNPDYKANRSLTSAGRDLITGMNFEKSDSDILKANYSNDKKINYSFRIKGAREAVQADPRNIKSGGYLDDNQVLALQYYEDTNPDLAATYEKLNTPYAKTQAPTMAMPEGFNKSENEKGEAYVRMERDLSITGAMLNLESTNREIDPLIDNPALNELHQKNIDAYESIYNDPRFALANQADDLAVAKELSNNGDGVIMASLRVLNEKASNLRNFANGIGTKLISSTKSDQFNNATQIGVIQGLNDENFNKIQNNKNLTIQNSEYVFANPAFKKDLDAINNSDLGGNDRQEKVLELIQKYNQAGGTGFSKISIDPKFNFSAKSLLMSVGTTATDLGAFMATLAFTGGMSAEASVVSKMAAMGSTVFMDGIAPEYARLLASGNKNPTANAILNTSINAAAMILAEPGQILDVSPSLIKRLLGKETAVGKMVNELTDKELGSRLSQTGYSKIAEFVKTNGIHAIAGATKLTTATTLGQMAITKLAGENIDYDATMKQAGVSLISQIPVFFGLGAMQATSTPFHKSALYEAASRPEFFNSEVIKMVREGKLTQEKADEIIKNTLFASQVLSKIENIDNDGKVLNDTKKADLLFQKTKEAGLLEFMKKDIPEAVREKVETEIKDIKEKVNEIYTPEKIEVKETAPEKTESPVVTTRKEAIATFTPEEKIEFKQHITDGNKEAADALVFSKMDVEKKVYTVDNIDTVDTEGYSGVQKEVIGDVKGVFKSVSNLVNETTGSPLSIHIHANDKSFAQVEGVGQQNAGSKGVYMSSDGSIHLNMARVTPETMLHEAFHPVLDVIQKNNPALIDNLVTQLSTIKGGDKIIENNNKKYNGDVTQKKEAITDFIAQVADGTFKINESNLQQAKNYFIDVIRKIGLGSLLDKYGVIKNAEELRALAKMISQKFNTGEEISMKDLGSYREKKSFKDQQEIKNKNVTLQNGEEKQRSGISQDQGNFEKAQYNGTNVIRERSRSESEKAASRNEAKQKIKNPETNVSLQAANDYNKSVGLSTIEAHDYKRSDKELQSEISNTYQQLQDVTSPTYKETEFERQIFDSYKSKYPELFEKLGIENYKDFVIKSYSELAKEANAQFESLPIKIEFHDGDQNYESSAEMLDDVHNFGHLWVYKGGEDHPLLGSKTADENGITANDKFRAVHDYFGHSVEGYQFGKDGEENAWIEHSKMFSPLAQMTLSTETRAQNSFVNYSGINDVVFKKIEAASALNKKGLAENNAEMIADGKMLLSEANNEFNYAEQKPAILPEKYIDAKRYFKDQENNNSSEPQFSLKDIDVDKIRTLSRAGKRVSKGLSVFTKNGEKVVSEAEDLSLDYVKQKAPNIFISNAEIISKMPIVSGIDKYGDINTIEKAQKVYDTFSRKVADNLNYLMDNFNPKFKEVSTLWYDGANILANKLSKDYSTSTEQVAGVIASLSPQKDWYQNVRLAEMVLIGFEKNPVMSDKMVEKQKLIILEGLKPFERNLNIAKSNYKKSRSKVNAKNVEELQVKFDDYTEKSNKVLDSLSELIGKDLNSVPNNMKGYFIRLYNEINTTKDYNTLSPDGKILGIAKNNNGEKSKVAWGSYSEINKAVSISLDGSQQNITRTLGEMHKIRNFYNNIIDPMSKEGDVTMDTHAVAAALLKPLSGNTKEVAQNFGTGTSNSSPNGIKGLYYAYAEGYKLAAKEANLLPRQVQSITWEAVRGLFTAEFKSSSKNVLAIEKIWKDYSENKITINEAREKITEYAGGIDNPTWAEPIQGGAGADIEAGNIGGGDSRVRSNTIRPKRGGNLIEQETVSEGTPQFSKADRLKREDDIKELFDEGSIDKATYDEYMAEVKLKTQSVTSTRNSTVAAEREARGLDMINKSDPETFEDWKTKGIDAIGKTFFPDTEALSIIKTPRALSAVENASMLFRRTELNNQRDDLLDLINEKGGENVDVETMRLLEVEELINRNDEAVTKSGTEAGRALAARRMMMADDYTLVNMERKLKAINGGKTLSKTDMDKLRSYEAQIKDLQEKLDNKDAKVEVIKNEVKKVTIKKISEPAFKAQELSIIERMMARKKSRNDAQFSRTERIELDKDDLSDIKSLFKLYVEQGVTDHVEIIDNMQSALADVLDISKDQLRDTISGYGKTSELSKEDIDVAMRDIKAQMKLFSSMEDVQNSERPLKSGLQREDPSDTVRQMRQQLNDMMKKADFKDEKSEKEYKSALDAIKKRLTNQIADIENMIATGERRQPSDKVEYDAEANRLLTERDNLKETLNQLDEASGLTAERKSKAVENTLKRSIENLERRINNNELEPKKADGTPDTEAITALRARKDELQTELTQLRKDAGIIDANKLEAYKKSLKKRAEEYQRRIDNNEFEKKTPEERKIDKQTLGLLSAIEDVKMKFDVAKLEFERKNMSAAQRYTKKALRFRRAILLSSFTTLGKIGAAGSGLMVTKPLEQIAGSGIRLLPGFKTIAADAPREGAGFSFKTEAKAVTELFRNRIKLSSGEEVNTMFNDMGRIMKGKKGNLESVYGKKVPHIEESEFFGNTHAVIKYMPKMSEVYRSMEIRFEYALRKGEDIADPVVYARIVSEAIIDGNRNIFMGKNLVTDAYKSVKRTLEAKGMIGKAGANVMDFLFPIVSVPTNFVLATAENLVGVAAAPAMIAMKGGVKKLTPAEKDTVMRLMKKGSVGLAFLALGIFNPASIGGYYSGKRKEGDLEENTMELFGVKIGKWAMHTPLLEVMQFGATVRRIIDKQNEDGEITSYSSAVGTASAKLTEEIPFVNTTSDLLDAMDDGNKGKKFLANTTSSLVVPPDVRKLTKGEGAFAPVAKALGYKGDVDSDGEVYKRRAISFVEQIEANMPGLRETLPLDVKAEQKKAKGQIESKLNKGEDPSQIDEALIEKAGIDDIDDFNETVQLDSKTREFKTASAEKQMKLWTTFGDTKKGDVTEYLRDIEVFDKLFREKPELLNEPKYKRAYNNIKSILE
jgi:hypothetical protein